MKSTRAVRSQVVCKSGVFSCEFRSALDCPPPSLLTNSPARRKALKSSYKYNETDFLSYILVQGNISENTLVICMYLQSGSS